MSLRLRARGYRTVPGDLYGTPKEVWGFRTRARHGSAQAVAREFIVANAGLFELEEDVSELALQKVIHSLGASHVIFRQVHKHFRVHRGFVTVHMDREGRVYLSKNRSVPPRLLPPKFEQRLDLEQALARARKSLPKPGRRMVLGAKAERLWYPKDDTLAPAWKLRIVRRAPAEEWIVHVNARTGGILSRYDNLAQATGRGRVFDPNPVTALGDHRLLIDARGRERPPPPVAYTEVDLPGLDGSGTLSGERVTTSATRVRRMRRADLAFLLESDQPGFEEVMVYYHVDSALRYLESLGFRGTRAIFREAVRADVNGTAEDNSWYSPADRLLTFGTGDIDDAEDAETILHELGHAIQDAICPDFGQSAEAAAMGEGFGDYFAASFFESRKPARYRHSVMSWDGLSAGLARGDDPPALRRVDSAATFASFDPDGDEHDNGRIWSATLWEIRDALGRETADRLILESHFQLDGFTTLARGARAILDADRNLQRGSHGAILRGIFQRRRIGPVA